MRSSSVIALDQPARAVQPRIENRALPRLIAARPRVDSIDLLRGLIMVVMVLDHTRDFFSSSAVDPRDVHDPALFLTRWVTHFCAPLFIFLAGLSAFLYGARGRTRQEVSLFLFTRGAWLVLLELTVVLFGWTFSPAFNFFVLQVIWAIGWSMIALAGLIYLPRVALAALALAMIGGHNLLDAIRAEQLQGFAWLWLLLHEPGFLQPVPGIKVLAVYPLVPWIGVMAAGYACGPVLNFPEPQRRRWLLGSGLSLVGIFVGLRALNVYGDPAPWQPSPSWSASILSFINCEKYPPSLLYLAMTLGPGLIGLALFERARGRLAGWLITFGRVPFFYYIGHIYLIHVVAVAAAAFAGGDLAWLFQDPIGMKPQGYGVSLFSYLSPVARNSAHPIPTLPLVRGAEAAAARVVAKLSLSSAASLAPIRKGALMSKAGDFFQNPVTGEAAIVRIGTHESDGELLMADLYIAPSGAVMGEHYHPAIEERFTLIRGELGVRLSGRGIKAKSGVTLLVPPGVPHDWWNAGEQDAVVRVEIRPAARFEVMILNAFGLAQDGRVDRRGMPNFLQLVVFAREFSDVVRFTQPPRLVQRVLFGLVAPFARLLGYRGSYPKYLTRRHEHYLTARRPTLLLPGKPLARSLLETV